MQRVGRKVITGIGDSGASGPRGLVVLVLLALCWAQLALAAHQFEHAATAADDACRVCAQLDRCDAPVATAAATPPPQSRSVPPRVNAACPAKDAALPPRQRAPPRP